MIAMLRAHLNRRFRTGSDDGAMLVFAIIVITTVALVTGALLGTSGTKFATTVQLRKVAGTAYAADAATKVAINDLVYGGSSTVPATVATYPNGPDGTPAGWVYENSTDGTGCFGKSTASGNPALDRITLPGVYTDSQSGTSQSATVVCKPVAGTSLFGSGNGTVIVQPDASDPFARALTTVGTTACTAMVTGGNCNDGISLKGLGSGTEIPMRGSIQSKTSINVSAGTLRTNGTVSCTSSTGSIVTATGTGCSGPFQTTVTPASPISAVPAWRNPATQGCSFQPGYYSNAAALSAAVNACTTATFASGKYYFDFTDTDPQWSINTTVIGGVPAGGSIPGRCVSPIESSTTSGVQFVFGGHSYLQIRDGARVELCGPANGGAAPLTLFQQQASTPGSSQTVTPGVAATVVDASTGSQVPFVGNPASCKNGTNFAVCTNAADAKSAEWSTTSAGKGGELDLSDFAGLDAIPPGSTITSATLKVTYTMAGGFGGTLQTAVAGQPGTINVAASGAGNDLTTQVAAAFAASPTGFTVTGPKVQLLVGGSTAKNKNLDIDTVTLGVSYTSPALRGVTSPQTFITDNGGNFAGKFVVQGATYAPNGYITLTPGSDAGALVSFRWGVFAWGVNFKSQPSQTWGYPLISIPDVGYGPGPNVVIVDLKTYLCAGSGPCATTGKPALSSRVEFTDQIDANGIVTPVAGQRQVSVLSWAEQK